LSSEKKSEPGFASHATGKRKVAGMRGVQVDTTQSKPSYITQKKDKDEKDPGWASEIVIIRLS